VHLGEVAHVEPTRHLDLAEGPVAHPGHAAVELDGVGALGRARGGGRLGGCVGLGALGPLVLEHLVEVEQQERAGRSRT
jgi:hypothetical protein